MSPSIPQLTLLLVAFRIAALVLYRPGGLIDPWTTSLYYFLLNDFPAAPPLLAPLIGGLLTLPFEVVTLLAMSTLARRAGMAAEAGERALWWAISPLSLWAYLTGPAPFYTALLLALFLLLRQPRRSWLLAALFLLAATIIEGPASLYPALLLPFILLLVPDPAVLGALYAAGLLLAGPFAEATGAQGNVSQALQVIFWLGAAPALLELGLMVIPVLGAHRWRQSIRWSAAIALVLLSALTIGVLLPAQVRAARLESSPMAPALAEMAAAPSGWLISDSHDLWEQAVALGAGRLTPRVVTARNLADLRAALAGEPTPIWLLDSGRSEAAKSLTALVEGYYVGDTLPLGDTVILRRYVSDAPIAAGPVPLDARFADGVTLAGARLPPGAQAGSLLPVELSWVSDPGAAKLFLHLLSGDGTLVAQRDAFPGQAPDRHALTLPDTLRPGPYTLIAGRYDPETLERVALSQGGDTIVIGTLDVRAKGEE